MCIEVIRLRPLPARAIASTPFWVARTRARGHKLSQLTAMAACRKYSGYYERLKDDVKKRYNEKLNIIGEAVDDPYTFSSGLGIDDMPSIEYPDIYNFLINTPSLYTKEELKAYKSLEGYKY